MTSEKPDPMERAREMQEVLYGFSWWNRCDWCGWPLKPVEHDGCTWNSCSMRPMPRLSAHGQLQQWVRHYVHEITSLLEEVERLKANAAGLWTCSECAFSFDMDHDDSAAPGHYTCPACENVELEARLREAEAEQALSMDARRGANLALSACRLAREQDQAALESLRSEVEALKRELEEARQEQDASDQLTKCQSDLLTGVVNALKGPPPELVLWSHHDAPVLARAVVAARDSYRETSERFEQVYKEERASRQKAEEERDALRERLAYIQSSEAVQTQARAIEEALDRQAAAEERAERAEEERDANRDGREHYWKKYLEEHSRLLDAMGRADRAERKRDQAREAGREYTRRTDPLLSCGMPDNLPVTGPCGNCRFCALERAARAEAERDEAKPKVGCCR